MQDAQKFSLGMDMRVIIIEDNEIEEENIRILLKAHDDIELIGSASNIETGMNLADKERPDLIFLDVQLGDDISLDYIDKLEYYPMIIFTTSYSSYALDAFNIGAIGYMMKPITRSSLDRALSRIRNLVAGPIKKDAADESVLLKTGTTSRIVSFNDIVIIEADRDYTSVLDVSGKRILCNEKMREWVELLPEDRFVRLDRSTIVNYKSVGSFGSLNASNRAKISFVSGQEIQIGPTALNRLRNAIK